MTAELGLEVLVLITILSVPLARALMGQGGDRFRPTVVFSACMILGYVVPIPGFLEGSDAFSLLWDTSYGAFRRSLTAAILLVILGALGFFAGFACALRGKRDQLCTQRMRRLRGAWDTQRLWNWGLGLTICGTSAFALGTFLIGGPTVLLSGLGDRLRLFEGYNHFFSGALLLPAVALVWSCYHLTSPPSRRVLFGVYVILSAVGVALLGNKSTLLVFLVSSALLYHILRKRIPWKTAVGAACVAVVVLTFYALIAREYLVMGEITSIDVDLNTVALVSVAVEQEVSGNLFQLQVLTTLVDRVPAELPFQYGQTFLTLFAIPFPRALWIDKPVTAPGVVTMAFWPDRWYDQGTTLPPGILGEMFLNFGWVGPPLGMFVLGIVYGVAYRNAFARSATLINILRYTILVALIPLYVRGEFVSPTLVFLIWMIPAAVMLRSALRVQLVS